MNITSHFILKHKQTNKNPKLTYINYLEIWVHLQEFNQRKTTERLADVLKTFQQRGKMLSRNKF